MSEENVVGAVSRRTVCKGFALAAGLSVAAGALGYSPSKPMTANGGEADILVADEPVGDGSRLPDGGHWQAVSCAHECFGNCSVQGYVKDGKVLRLRTDQAISNEDDNWDTVQHRACIRGRSQRFKWENEGRLKYPMKRKHWQPGGGENSQGQLRGIDEWERISWDEAFTYIADELKRVREEYGNRAIFTPGYLGLIKDCHPGFLLDSYGGSVTTWGDQSQGAWALPSCTTFGKGVSPFNDRYSLLDAKLIVLWGCNYAHSAQTYEWVLQMAKRNGARVINIDPWFSASAQSIADQWIPIRPGTDQAMLLAMAYHMIENNLYDKAFVDKYTVGFDAEHMPADAKDDQNFKGYVMGEYDGVPKTPEWASKHCGVPADVIRAFTEEVCTTDPVTFYAGLAPARTDSGSMFCRLFYTIGWMTGNVGRSGAEVSYGRGFNAAKNFTFGNHGIDIKLTDTCTPARADNQANKILVTEDSPFMGFAYCDAYNAIINGEFVDFSRGKKPANIKLIYEIGFGAPLNQTSDINLGIEAYRKVDFVVVSDYFMCTDAKYADIVLPAASAWEREWTDVFRYYNEFDPTDDSLSWGTMVAEPGYEIKNDIDIELGIAEKLGLGPTDVYNISQKQATFNRLVNATFKDRDGENRPIATVTQEDLDEWGCEGEPQEGLMPLKEFYESGRFVHPYRDEEEYHYVAFKSYIEDPEANPLPTPSGKFEIRCETFSEWNNAMGLSELGALPVMEEQTEGYENMFDDWDNQIKGDKYNFQMVNIHYIGHSHSEFCNIPEVAEFMPNDLLMNTKSAAELGIESGDTVLMENDHGKVLRRVCVTPRVMPGVVIYGQGNWPDIDPETGIDRGGAANTVCGARLLAQGYQPWNSCLVKISKWDGEPLEPEYLRLKHATFVQPE